MIIQVAEQSSLCRALVKNPPEKQSDQSFDTYKSSSTPDTVSSGLPMCTEGHSQLPAHVYLSIPGEGQGLRRNHLPYAR